MRKKVNLEKALIAIIGASKEQHERAEGGDFRLYKGIAPVKVLAVNPTKQEMDSLNGRDNKGSEYTGSDKDGNSQCRIDFIVKTVTDRYNGIDGVWGKVTFYVSDGVVRSKDGNIEVIDEYGDTAWATEEQVKKPADLYYKNGKKVRITQNYRPSYRGEAKLTQFLKTLLGLNPYTYKDGAWILKPDAKMHQCRLDSLSTICRGDVREIKLAVAGCANAIKVAFGIQTNDEGKMYQKIYNRAFMGMYAHDTAWIAKDIQRSMEAGGLKNEEYEATLNFHAIEMNKAAEEKAQEPVKTEENSSGSEDYELPF